MNEKRFGSENDRRTVLRVAAAAGLVLLGCGTTTVAGCAHRRLTIDGENGEAEVTPGEDLMQEHGALERLLLVYEEAARRIEVGQTFDLTVLAEAASIVRRFVEDYHEKLEEQFVFPRLQSVGRETELVSTLLQQHRRGRQLTDEIVRRISYGVSAELVQALRGFIRMYRPHAAREDTVLFPAFRRLVGRAAYLELGAQFEEKEHELLGEHGFDKVVADIARLEAALGIDELAVFTAP